MKVLRFERKEKKKEIKREREKWKNNFLSAHGQTDAKKFAIADFFFEMNMKYECVWNKK